MIEDFLLLIFFVRKNVKKETYDGIMFGASNDLRNLGKLAIYNLGLEEVVKNAPKRLSLNALAYLAQDYK